MIPVVVKTGFLTYHKRGFISKKWTVGYFCLRSDSSLQWFTDKDDTSPEGLLFIKPVANLLSVGQFTRCIPKRPELKTDDDSLLIAIPKNLQKDPKEIMWLNCNNFTELK